MPYNDYPESAVNNAKKALKHKEENGSDCGTAVGWTRANQIANKEKLSVDTIKRTFSFLSRAKTYDQGKYTDENGNEICGSIMYDAWGGDSMRTWAEKKLNNLPESERQEKMEKEIRTFGLELRAMDQEEKRTVRGYAATFESRSGDLGGFIESIDREAFSETDMEDVRALFNHDSNFVLGRTKAGTLRLMVDENGLAYEIDMPDTQLGRDMYESIKRGDISQSSFAFTIEDDEYRKEGDTVYRTIKKIKKLYDVAPVTFPAYESTSVQARKIDELKNKELKEEHSDADAIRQRELYLLKLNKK
jgi:HK97 family phage prohead protease